MRSEKTPPPPAPAPHRLAQGEKSSDVEAAIKDIRLTLQRTKTLPLQHHPEEESEENAASPVWVPRQRGMSTASGDSERKVNSGGEEGRFIVQSTNYSLHDRALLRLGCVIKLKLINALTQKTLQRWVAVLMYSKIIRNKQ
ncbi:hypothetical protein NQ318_012865 [Aromia moschata]|uniref:Uncharacterized protein n=1 Tax=Aromia moschata TaxID=1265417 RepID=A0AAV8YBZ8_9CUCU|nr:hypothetical protein NQ318_012865 [Aromia moschata]